jgi:hypothetical protein
MNEEYEIRKQEAEARHLAFKALLEQANAPRQMKDQTPKIGNQSVMNLSDTLQSKLEPFYKSKRTPLLNQLKTIDVPVPEEYQLDERWEEAMRVYAKTLEGREAENFVFNIPLVHEKQDIRYLGHHLEKVRALLVPERSEIHEITGYDS